MRARLLLLAAALVAFGASLGSGFHFDDYAIFADPALTSPRRLARGVARCAQTRPLTYLTFWLNCQSGGGDPAGYHVFNLLLHLGAVLLLYECLRRLLPERAALVAAALFALHPVQAEAVNYVWARSILLATVFCLLSLRAWLRRAAVDARWRGSPRRCWPRRSAPRFRWCCCCSTASAGSRSPPCWCSTRLRRCVWYMPRR